MDAAAVADALVAWADQTIPSLGGLYDHDPDSKDQPLPDLAAFVSTEDVRPADPTLGIELAVGLEQVNVHAFACTLLFAVDPTDAQAATAQLQGFVAALSESVKADSTLGGRVQAVSPYWRAGYEPPFVKFDDGSEARAATFSLTITELV